MYKKTIEVDTKTFVRFWLVILGFALAALLIWKAATALIIIGIAMFLSIAIQPLAKRISHLLKNDHPVLSTVIAYILVIGIFGTIFAVVGPVVIEQTTQFVKQLPETFQNTLGGWDGINEFGQHLGIENLQKDILSAIQSFSNGFVSNLGNFVVTSVGAVASVTTNVVLTIVLTLFFSLEGPSIVESAWSLIEDKRKANSSSVRAYRHLADRMVAVVSTYVSHQVMVALLDGSVVAIIVLILSFVFNFSAALALPMGLIAMVFYLIPMFGPIISCILIAIALLFSSPVASIAFLISYIIYAQIENNVIAPKIQGDALNLPATLILVAIIIGMNVFGLIGAIIAIPIAGCIKVVFEELPNLREAGAIEA